jgi:alpha-tubulin suppressor-like RCC1 family protein
MKRLHLACALLGALLLAAVAAAPASATSDGVMVWGGGELYNFGLLGKGSTTQASDAPLGVGGVEDVAHVSIGFGQVLALRTDGTLTAWGSNAFGELGVGSGPESCGSLACSSRPVSVSGLSEVTAIAAGGYHSLALLRNGTVMAWGEDLRGQLGPETAPETCGEGATPCSRKPIPVPGLSNVVAIAGGYRHSLALLSNGTVMAWGENTTGELGNGTTTDSSTPVEVKGLTGVLAVAAGYAESMALLSNGTVMAWGGNGHGQLGQEEHPPSGPEACGPESEPCSTTPLAVKGLSGVKSISDGYWNAAAVLTNGKVMTWGNNATGELGIGTTAGPETCPFPSQPCSSTPVAVSGLSGISEVSTSKDTEVLALREDGRVMAWGVGSGGQLGNGVFHGREKCKSNYYCSTTPVQVVGIVDATGIAAGAESGIAVLALGSAPEYGRCIKVAPNSRYEGGKYENAGCTKEGTEQKYEWYPGVDAPKFTTAAGEVTLQTPKFGVTLRCKTESGSGEYSSRTNLSNVVVTFHECEEGIPAGKCTSPGAAEGDVVTAPLTGVLGIEKLSPEGAIKNKIALQLSPSGGVFTEFSCPGAGPTVVRGSVLVPVMANMSALTANRVFKLAKGKQKPEKFEAGPVAILEQSIEGEPFESVGLTSTVTQTSEEKVEINTVA